MSDQSERQRLDFEDEDARRERLGRLFGDLSSPAGAGTGAGAGGGVDVSLPRMGEWSRPHAMPESDVLARVRAFLPDFQSSTAELVRQSESDPDSVNLERVGKGQQAIAMDLGLGVYDAPGAASAAAGEGGVRGGLGPVVDTSQHPPQHEDEEESSSGSSDDEEEDTSEEEEEEEGNEVMEKEKKQ